MSLANLYHWNSKNSQNSQKTGSACGSGDKVTPMPSACGAKDAPQKATAACGAKDLQ